MKKILRAIACSLVISMLFSCAAFAKPVHTNLLSDEFSTDSVLNFVSIMNEVIQEKKMDLPLMTNFILMDDGFDDGNTYIGCWGSSSVIIKEDKVSHRIKYISVSLPRAYYNNGTVEVHYFALETGFLKSLIEGLNDNISDADSAAATKKIGDCIESTTSCTCTVGKLHYNLLFGDNVIFMSFSAITDDGTK
ncbi:hypothetical protein SDC9_158347 [bioreactor metagenome]|uniref:Uncharacterized protein n=1 Tax=bioreactor metagenome TaxID=1076179 RepID=A0A645FBQ1_9ZZZZ|nr:hypothetical protein [Candidatus Metalachnospira sp.]